MTTVTWATTDHNYMPYMLKMIVLRYGAFAMQFDTTLFCAKFWPLPVKSAPIEMKSSKNVSTVSSALIFDWTEWEIIR